MADHELELHGKLGLPELGGFAVRIEARYRAAWGKRGADFTDTVQTVAGISQDELGEHLDQDERFRDIFLSAGQRAVEVGDSEYRSVLGRLVAAALDEAKVDEAEHLLTQLVKLEPLHLRALVAAFEFWHIDAEAGEARMVRDSRSGATDCQARAKVTPGDLAEELDVGVGLAAAILDVLGSAGFLREEVGESFEARDGVMQDGSMPLSPRRGSWHATDWGSKAMCKLFPDLRHR